MNFQQSRLSLRRSIWSYSKVQVLVGHLIRGRRFQLRRAAVYRPYLNLGCGDHARPEFLNVDYAWHRHVDLCWDATRGLPFPDGKFSGVFTEHMLEHLLFEDARRVARDLWRVLRPGGRIRIVVPDGALYLMLYSEASSPAGGARFPYQDTDGFEGMYTPMMSVNRLFYDQRGLRFGHNFIYDFETLRLLLDAAGFVEIEQHGFGSGRDPVLVVDDELRRVESLYVEAMKPLEKK